MRIAIMMLVHKNEQQVQRLINHLSNDFDVYVHIDKNISLKINEINNAFVYKKYKTYWGSFNIVLAMLYLLNNAFLKKYDRYIFISGQDLPLKSNSEIKDFFRNNNFEYIELEKLPIKFWGGNGGLDRLTDYHMITGGIKKHHLLSRLFNKIFHKNIFIENYIYKVIMVKTKPRKIDYLFYGGSQWTNYTNLCVSKIFEYLEFDKKYIRRYKWTNFSDEIFFQTIIAKFNSLSIENYNLRYIDWENGPEYPKILREEDYEKIIASKALFARKFDENVDNNIIEKIYNRIGEKNKSRTNCT
jgi:hypothetical protein